MPAVEFLDTRGSNGHIAEPEWLDDFIGSLGFKPSYRILRKLPAYQGIPAHRDEVKNGGSVHYGTRYHVPLITHPDVFMRFPDDGTQVHMEAGYLYRFDHSRTHEVVHLAPVDRVHVVFNVQES